MKTKREKKGGRSAGTPNRATAKLRAWVEQLLTSSTEQLSADMASLEPLDRLKVCEKLLAFVLPKQSAVMGKIDLEALSDEDLDKIIGGL